MKTIKKNLTVDQIKEGVIYSSCLSACTTEQSTDTIQEVLTHDIDKWKKIERLQDTKFFKGSHFKFNIVRK